MPFAFRDGSAERAELPEDGWDGVIRWAHQDWLAGRAANAVSALEINVLSPYRGRGIAQLMRSINLVRSRLNPRLAVAGVLITMADARTNLAADVEREVRRHFGELVFRTVVPRSVRVAEAPSHGLPVTHYDRRSPGAEAYWKVAMELVERA